MSSGAPDNLSKGKTETFKASTSGEGRYIALSMLYFA